MSIEDPDADRREQQLPVYDDAEDTEYLDAGELPPEADPSDVLDQRHPVPYDDEPGG